MQFYPMLNDLPSPVIKRICFVAQGENSAYNPLFIVFTRIDKK